GPRWWNGETFNPEQSLFVADRFSFRVQIVEVFAFRSAAVAGPLVINVLKASFLRSLHRISRDSGFDSFPVPTVGPTRSHSENNHWERVAPANARRIAVVRLASICSTCCSARRRSCSKL